jgi:predicted nuclease of predicted toxin-antitoxin system
LKLKLDENLGAKCADVLKVAGHDVETVQSHALTSASDDEVIAACRAEARALITLDLDFSNPLIYPPERHSGIAVLRMPARQSYVVLLALVRTLIDALKREDLTGQLWSVEAGRVRIYQPPSED